jgi:hypothetical protein
MIETEAIGWWLAVSIARASSSGLTTPSASTPSSLTRPGKAARIEVSTAGCSSGEMRAI